MRFSRSLRAAASSELAGHSSSPLVVKDAIVLMALAVAFTAGLILIVAGLL